ncbi:MAG TPA: hypothetical protein DCZ41_04170, partial [Firmicutes bacterium]|nr:hypothetical protein [Bacillota bacterium]
STVRDGFIPMEAYKQTGITCHSIVSSPTHLEVIEIAIREIGRTQKPKLVYIDLNGLNNQTKGDAPVFVKDYYSSMPDDNETKQIKKELRKKYPYLTDVSEWEPFKGHNSFRQQVYWESFVYNAQFYTKGYYPHSTSKEVEVSEVDENKTLPFASKDATTYLNEILGICKEFPNIHFLFGQMPRYLSSTISSFDAYQKHAPLDAYYMVKNAKKDVEEAGYTFLDYGDPNFLRDVLKLDPTKDQYDAEHLNHRGALKFTKYFSNYLLNAFYGGKKPKHSEEILEEFDKSYVEYLKIVEKAEKKLGIQRDDESL